MELFRGVLTLVTGPHKRHSLAIQTANILTNRQEVLTPITPITPVTMPAVEQVMSPRPVPQKRDTGFPEPFSLERNTTLPHPDANLGPNPTIEGPDIALDRRNSRRSFHRNGRVKSSGKIPLAERGMIYENLRYVDGSTVRLLSENEPLSPVSTTGMTSASESGDMRGSGDSGVFMNADERDENGYRDGERKKSLLRKWALSKN